MEIKIGLFKNRKRVAIRPNLLGDSITEFPLGSRSNLLGDGQSTTSLEDRKLWIEDGTPNGSTLVGITLPADAIITSETVGTVTEEDIPQLNKGPVKKFNIRTTHGKGGVALKVDNPDFDTIYVAAKQ